MYTLEKFNLIQEEQKKLEDHIADIASRIDFLRNGKDKYFRRGSFERYEINYDDEGCPIKEKNYYKESNGEYTNWDTGSTFAEDMASYNKKRIDNAIIDATFYAGYDCEYFSISFPLMYLFTENWEEIERAIISEKEEKQRIKDEAVQEERRKQKEENDRKEWERLNKLYGKDE